MESVASNARFAPSVFQGRIQRDSTTQISLQPYAGRYIEVRGQLVDIAAGFTLLSSANQIDSAGADTGGSLSASTLYYCYVSNSRASFAPSGIRLSTQAPSSVNGVKYLNTTGNALNWRFVGWVRTNGSTQFVKDQRQCFVTNYYNKIDHSLFYCPNYNVSAQATYTPTSSNTYIALAVAGPHLEFISNGEDAFDYAMAFDALMAAGGTVVRAGVAESTQLAAKNCSEGFFVQNANAVQERKAFHVSESPLLSAGYHYLTMMFCDDNGGGVTVIANPALSGGAETMPTTYIRALVPA